MLKKFIGLALFASLTLPAPALATPERAEGASERFAAMDADKNGLVSWEEFSAYYPQMTKAAFETIDSSKDGFIDAEEWRAFSGGHARDMSRQGSMGGMPGAGKTPGEKKTMPLLPMPKK